MPSHSEASSVKLQNAGLDDRDGEIVAHGWIEAESLDLLKVDTYQREVLAPTNLSRGKGANTSLLKALIKGERLPDVILGVRGADYTARGNSIILKDSVYIIDGLQRISAVKQFVERYPDKANGISLGAEVRFNTTRASEDELFTTLNTKRVPVSPNILIRNMRESNHAVTTLYGLSTNDPSSVIYKRVQWNQRRLRGELLTALAAVQISGNLHRFSGLSAEGRAVNSAKGLLRISDNVGLRVFRENISTFFELIDECWGIKTVEFRQTATHLRTNFLVTVARMISDHTDFWDNNRLNVPTHFRKKLATFPIMDPEIARLAAAGTMTMPILYDFLRKHLNKGKRTHHLHLRKGVKLVLVSPETDDNE